MTRPFRTIVGLLGIAAVLFAQLAVSAYACPMLTQDLAVQVETLSISAASSADADSAQPSLCQKHCEDEQQNVNDSTTPVVSLAITPATVVSLLVLETDYIPAPPVSPALLHATSPPIPIRNCCFRI